MSILVFVFAGTALFAQPNLKQASRFAKSITAGEMHRHLSVIAGPEMEGRETGTRGEHRAAEYLVSQLQELGVEPANNGQYLMPFPVFRDSVQEAAIAINGKNFLAGKDFQPYINNFTSQMRFGEVLFINPEDSAFRNNRLNVSGRLVMMQQPAQQRGRRSANPVFELLNRGASAILVVSNNEMTDDGEWRNSGMSTSQYPTRQVANSWLISPAMAREIAGGETPADTRSFPAQVELKYNESSNHIRANNVVGIIRGTKYPDEYVVLSAHYDHTGKRGDVISYGADDDGSGTVGLLGIAKAFQEAKARKQGPEKSVVFLWVSGEEKGLWGSHFYSENPVFPLEKTTANLNIDMIGRVDTIFASKKDSANYVYVIGDNRISSELAGITTQANSMVKLTLDPKYNAPDDPERIYFRSDHYNFARKGVPAIFYFNGIHEDYHRPTDTVDKINFPLLAKRSQLVFYTAWLMANRPGLLSRDRPLENMTR